MGRTCWKNFMFWAVKKGSGRALHTTQLSLMKSNKNSFYGEMKNDKLWQMKTMNCVLNLLSAICAALCMRVDGGKWSRECGWGRMKWLYGSICNAIKWTLNMHNNPLLSLSPHLPVVSLPLVSEHTHTRMSWIAENHYFLVVTEHIFLLSLYSIFEQIWTHAKSLLLIHFHFNSNPITCVCFIYVKAYSSLYSSSSSTSCRWRILTENWKHLTSRFFQNHIIKKVFFYFCKCIKMKIITFFANF